MQKPWIWALSLLLAAVLAPARAQDSWPSRPVKVIVPSSPGGGTDLYARLISHALGEVLNQQFVVDKRPGASGNIGAEAVARASPDGYTILVSANPALTVNPSLYRKLAYNAERDFAPIARGVRVLEEVSGARFTHVPDKGIGQGYKDLLSGQLAFMYPDAATAAPYIRSGKVVALALNEKTPLLPGVPTFKELGYPAVDDVFTSFSVVAPAGTPGAIIPRLGAEIAKAMKSPALADKLEPQGLVPVFDTPEQAAASLKKERDGWATFIRRNNIQQEE